MLKNFERHKQKLNELLTAYELTVLGCDVWQASFIAIENQVLREHEFYAAMASERHGIRPGDRITDENCTFLLTKSDFARYQDLATALFAKEGLTDERGYYKENWSEKVCKARNELYDFIVEHLVPEEMRERLRNARLNVTVQNKFIDVLKRHANPKRHDTRKA